MAYINNKKVLSVFKTEFVPAVYQEKTITPSNFTPEVVADYGYAGLSKVKLDGILVDPHNPYTTQTDTTTAYTKSVPSGTLKYATLNKLGYMCYISDNWIILPDIPETTTNGVTWKIQNGTIYLNGTASAYFSINLLVYCQRTTNVTLKFFDIQGTSSKSSIIRVNNTYQSPTTTGTYYSEITTFVLYTDYSHSFTNYQIKPMLVSGSTAPTEWKQGFTGIRDSVVPSIKSTSSDLKYNMQYGYYIDSDGAAQEDSNSLYFDVENVKPNTEYYLDVAGLENSTNIKVFCFDYSEPDSTLVIQLSEGYFTTPAGTDQVSISIYNERNKYTDSFIGEVIDEKVIPNEVQALEGYGCGINSSIYNYIDLITSKTISGVDTTKSYTQKVNKYTFTGNESLTEYTRSNDNTKTYAFAITGRATTKNVLFAPFNKTTATTMNTMEDNTYRGATDTTSVIFYSTSYQTSASMLSFLTGKTIYYELATTVETDISSYIDNEYIEAEGNGMLVFDNTYKQAVPSEVTYLVEVSND